MATCNAMWQVGGFQAGRDWKYLVTQARQLPRNAKSYTYIQDGNAGTQNQGPLTNSDGQKASHFAFIREII